jgi:hypothetical protein
VIDALAGCLKMNAPCENVAVCVAPAVPDALVTDAAPRVVLTSDPVGILLGSASATKPGEPGTLTCTTPRATFALAKTPGCGGAAGSSSASPAGGHGASERVNERLSA